MIDAVDRLIRAGFIEDAEPSEPTFLDNRQIDRYTPNIDYFAWIDIEPTASPFVRQERLTEARATVIGAGGTGSAAAASLVAAGVGHLHLVDGDCVSESNLTRQLLYCEADVGRPKVEAAAARLTSMNTGCDVTGEATTIAGAEDVRRSTSDADIALLCADTPPGWIQTWVNAVAFEVGVPWIWSAYQGPMLVVGTFIPGQTGCYSCIDRSQERQRTAGGLDGVALMEGHGRNAVIAPAANLAGHLAALDAIHCLTGLPVQTAGRIFHLDLRAIDRHYWVEPTSGHSPVCGTARRRRSSQ